MIRSFELVNFRGFKSAEIKECKRINVIVGRNGSGKTSLLEGLFLACGPSPEVVFRLRQWRGFEAQVMAGAARVAQKAMWGDLFHEFDGVKPVKLYATGDIPHNRQLTIRPSQQNVTVSFDKSAPSLIYDYSVSFTWKVGKDEIVITPVVDSNGVHMPPIKETPTEVFFYAANVNYSAAESAGRLSDLSKSDRLGDFETTFKERYPVVENISIEIYAGAPMIFAKVKHVREKVPLNLLSAGMSKLAAILLAFPTAPKSIVLIDEIENGLYYRDLPAIWQSLLRFANKFDCQIFASTHSRECIEAAASVAESSPSDFSVIQASGGGLHQFQGESFVRAIEDDIEIR